jgi:tRNA 2-selenouridine synthase
MTDLAAALMADHYDPAYAKSRAVHAPERIGTVAAESLDAASLDKAAQEVAEIVRSA